MKEIETQFIPKDIDLSEFQAKDFDDYGEEKINERERRDHQIHDETDYKAPPGSRFPRPRGFGLIVLLVLIILALMTALGIFKNKNPQSKTSIHSVQINTKAPIFVNQAYNLGLGIDLYNEFFTTTPDGSKLVFSATGKNNPNSQTYLANLESGAIQKLDGNIASNWVNNNTLTLVNENNTVVYDFTTGHEYKMDLGGNIHSGNISPDGKLYIMHTMSGIQLLHTDNGIISKISSSIFDGAFAWKSDNIHVLGYRDTGVKLANGENARNLTIWDITNNSFVDLPTQVPIQEIKYVEWIVTDKIIRINAGYDDNSHDYMMDLSLNKIIDIGDTSGMSGIETDTKFGILATVGSIYSTSKEGYLDIARIYNSSGNIINEIVFQKPADGFTISRESVQIVDENTLLYVRKSSNIKNPKENKNNLILLDMKTGVENVFKGLSTNLSKVELLDNKETWITSDNNQFYIGSIKTGVISPSIQEIPEVENNAKKDTDTQKSIIGSPIIQNQVQTKNPNDELLRKYLNIHLNELSNIKAVSGGKFYVTDLQITNNNSGIVWYEDGHIAARAFFNYVISGTNVSITQLQAEKLLLTGGKAN